MPKVLCIVKNINEKDISIQLKPDFEVSKTIPDKYDTAGISGAPLITLVQNKIFTWRLAGVIYEANVDLEIYFARQSKYISSDGNIVEQAVTDFTYKIFYSCKERIACFGLFFRIVNKASAGPCG